MILLLSALAAATIPQLNGHLIRPSNACYVISRATPDGLKQIGTMRQTVKRLKHGGAEALEIATHQQISNPKGEINLTDTYLVRRKDLRPIAYRSAMGGKPTVELSFTENGVTGTKQVKGETVTVDQRFERPTWDANIWGSLMGALPLKAGTSYSVPSFQYADGLGETTFKVVGEEMIDTPKGRERAWVIDSHRDPARVARYFISKKTRQELGYQAMGFKQSLSNTCPKPV